MCSQPCLQRYDSRKCTDLRISWILISKFPALRAACLPPCSFFPGYALDYHLLFSCRVIPTWASCSKDSRITRVITVCTLATTSCSFVAMKLHTWTYTLVQRFSMFNAAVLWCFQWSQTTMTMPKCLSSLCTTNFIWCMSVTQHQFKIWPYYWANCKYPHQL